MSLISADSSSSDVTIPAGGRAVYRNSLGFPVAYFDENGNLIMMGSVKREAVR